MKIAGATGAAGVFLLLGCLGSNSLVASVDVPSTTTAPSADPVLHRKLQIALQKAQQTDGAAQADTALRDVIDFPGFNTLDTAEQHLALAAAASVALQLDQPRRAQSLIMRATGLPEQSIDDWRVRLTAAARLDDAREEVNCVTTIVHRWGSALEQMPDAIILHAVSDARKARLDEERLGMLELLYDIRWKLSDDREPSAVWRELCLLELEKNHRDQAIEVAAHIAEPHEVIVMRADNRYRPLFKSDFVPHDVRKVTEAQIEQSRTAMEARPRLLSRVVRLGNALQRSSRDQETLSLTDDVMQRVEPGGVTRAAGAPRPYDDLDDQYAWVLELRAQALEHLGRFDEAVAMRRHAVEWPGNKDTVSHRLNLASSLYELDRPQEALAVLPPPDKASAYGRMVIQITRLAAAIEQADDAEAGRALAYLREHQDDSAHILQKALVIAGRDDECAALLLSRLSDSALRSEVLVELQDYVEPTSTPRVMQWRARFKLVRERAEVRAAIKGVGRIDRYPVNYALF
jgi:beta-barrel assembly-enhancing protease